MPTENSYIDTGYVSAAELINDDKYLMKRDDPYRVNKNNLKIIKKGIFLIAGIKCKIKLKILQRYCTR